MTRKATSTLLAIAFALTGALAGDAAAAGDPAGVHVTFGADPRTSMSVSWHTSGSADPGTFVEFGPAPSSLDTRVAGTSQMAFQVPTRLHDVTLTGLSAGATVYYRAGSDGGWSEVFSFRTAPAAGSKFSFTVFGDHGTKAQSMIATAESLAEEADFHVIPGDLSYADENLPVWDTWFEQIQPLAANRPMLIAPGNHETEEGPAADGSTTFRQRFALPGQELYYSVQYGRVHFQVFHSTVAAAQRENIWNDMLLWAEGDLREAAGRRANGELDWIVVVQHHPIYASGEGSNLLPNQNPRQRNFNLIVYQEHMLHRWGVDLVITAHNHHYERTTPVAYTVATAPHGDRYTRPNPGFVEVVTGGGGRSLYLFRDPNDVEPWSVVRARRYHYMRFEVDGNTLHAKAIGTDPDGPRIFDTWTLTRS